MSKLITIAAKETFKINCKKESDTAEILIYGAIGDFWGDSISAKDFIKALKEIPSTVKNLDIRLNSPGGDVFDGFSIYNVLKMRKEKKTVYVDGMAFSIASVIALAGDEVVMGEGAQFMVHLPWTWAMGNKNDLLSTIDRLEAIEEDLVNVYHKKTKLEKSVLRDMLAKETFLLSNQAVEYGFADRTMEDTESLNMAAAHLDKASWIRSKPKMADNNKIINEKIKGLRKNIEGYLAR